MRKKLFLFSLLTTISYVSFSKEQIIQIKAVVVKPLNIVTENINFGFVGARETNVGVDGSRRSSEGKISITGEPGKNLHIEIPKMTLKRQNGIETMEITPYDGTLGNVGGTTIILSAEGTWSETFRPKIPTVASVLGTYVGTGKVTVIYE